MSKVNLGSPGSETPSAPSRLPRDNYRLRILKEPAFKVSQKSGNAYLQFEFEICEPVSKVIDGKEANIGGLEISCVCVLPPANSFMLEALHKAADLPMDFDLDEETGLPVGISYQGREVWATCQSREEVQMKEDNTPLLHPVTGKPMTFQRREIKSFLS